MMPLTTTVIPTAPARKVPAILRALCVSLLAWGGGAAHAADAVPGEVLVKFRSSPGTTAKSGLPPAASAVLGKHGFLYSQSLATGLAGTAKGAKPVNPGTLPHRLVFSTAANLGRVIADLEQLPEVEYAEPNYVGSLSSLPTSEPSYGTQQADLALIGMEGGWQAMLDGGYGAGGNSSVVVAIIDSGVDAAHIEFSGALDSLSWDFVQGNSTVTDDIGHGTRVAGILGARKNNVGIAGIAFDTRLLSLDVADSSGTITAARVAQALAYAATNGAHVINMSFQFSGFSQALQDACNTAAASGAVLVASAGNGNQGDRSVYPASFPNVLGVGAVEDDGATRASFSNYNGVARDLVDLVAPGVTIFSTIPGSLYNGTFGSGTSFAAPQVAGVAALLKTKYPAQSNAAIAAHLKLHASSVAGFAPANGAGSGRLNAAAALATPMAPAFAISAMAIDDSTALSNLNNADGTLDKSETANLRFTLRNSGADITQATGTLTIDSPLVAVSDNQSTWGVIGSGSAAAASDTFTVLIDSSATATLALGSLSIETALGTSVLPVTLNLENEVILPPGTNIPTATTWTADNTYIVEGQMTVFDNLTIQPGTTVRVKPGARVEVVGGNLSAAGTPVDPIKFLGINPEDTQGLVPDDLAWARRSGGSISDVTNGRSEYGEYGGAVALGPDGSTLVAGAYREAALFGTVSLGNMGSSTFNPAGLIYSQGFLAKYNSEGSVLWARALHTREGLQVWANSVRADGATLVGGIFHHELYLNGTTVPTLTANGHPSKESDVFLACFDANGALSWARRIGVSGSSDERLYALVTLGDGSTIAAIQFRGTISIDNGAGVPGSLTSAGVFDIALVKYDSSGTLQWAVSAGGSQDDRPEGLTAFADGSFCVTGYYTGSATFGDIPNQAILTNPDGGTQTLAFVARYNSNGSLAWARQLTGSGFNSGKAVAVAPDGSILATGTFRSNPLTVAAGMTLVPANTTQNDVYLVKYDGNGTAQWARKGGGTSVELVNGAAAMPDGGCIITGQFRGTSVWGAGDPNQTTIVSAGVDDLFYARFNSDGTLKYAKRAGSSTGDIGYGIASDKNGNVSVAGAFTGTTTFGAGEPGEATFTSFGGSDIFVLRLAGDTSWGGLTIRNSAAAANLQYVNFDRGQVTNELAGATINNCTFSRSPGHGLLSTAGTTSVTLCTATTNRLHGLSLGGRPADSCVATTNRSNGILTTSGAWNCVAVANYKDGVDAAGVTSCSATLNKNRGLVSSAGVQVSTARQNVQQGIVCTGGNVTNSAAELNTGTGVALSGGGTASNNTAKRNGSGGITITGSTVDQCTVEDNTGVGIAGSGSTVTNSRISSNTLAGVSGVTTLQGSTLYLNGTGLSGVTTVNGNYIAANYGVGITGGAVANTTVLANKGHGVVNPTSVINSWVLENTGIGVSSNNTGSVSFSTIRGNLAGGAQNLGAAGVQNSNLYGNGIFDAKDTQTAVNGTADQKNFENNWWGTAATALMNANPFSVAPPYNVDPYIVDGFDGTGAGHYLDYTPVAAGTVASAPDTGAPTFLLQAEPSSSEAVGIGPTTFTLVFSRDMNTAVQPSVTFGLAAPYQTHVVAADPGWLDARSWQGQFAVQLDTGEGLNTMVVSNAGDASGFVIPDDSRFSFTIASGHLGANNGLVTVSTGSRTFQWGEDGKDKVAGPIQGYKLMRSTNGNPGSYQPVTSLLSTNSGTDATAVNGDTYYYYVALVDANGSSVAWTVVLKTTINDQAGVSEWITY